ncbi:MAG: endonuclease [Proteobacteria bacterium]|nr:endonuclease [Pseudomonadota bacterium]NBP12818.1 endonuclease [bacterium]
MNTTEEIWKPIEGFAGYEISNQGNIRKFLKKNKIFKNKLIFKNLKGYYTINLYNKNTTKHKRVHRLVAEAFIPNPDNKPQINHINGIKTDNRVENLEWCTGSENTKHAYSIGLKQPKKGLNNSRTKPVMVIDKNGNHVLTIYGKLQYKEYGFDSGAVSLCCSGKRKHHKGYTFRHMNQDKDSSL